MYPSISPLVWLTSTSSGRSGVTRWPITRCPAPRITYFYLQVGNPGVPHL